MTTPAHNVSVKQIDALLPQTQCTQCDYPRCLDYAGAIANGDADINQCPPGGSVTIEALAALTGRAEKPLNPENGENEPRVVAIIDEAACIGCKLCIKACPVDCIIGAGKLMHTVIAIDCTGCKLCVPVCPTDCIDLIGFAGRPENQPPSLWPDFSQPQVEKARRETSRKIERMADKESRRARQKAAKERGELQQEIRAVLARKRSG